VLYIITEVSKKNGIGHFQRMLTLSSQLQPPVFFILFNDINYKIQPTISHKSFSSYSEMISAIVPLKGVFLVDLRNIPKMLLKTLASKKSIYYDFYDYKKIQQGLILNPNDFKRPSKLYPHLYYYEGFPYFIYNIKKSSPSVRKNKVLISFGGSDPFSLTNKILKLLDSSFSQFQFTIIDPHQENKIIQNNKTILPQQKTLSNFIKTHSIIITSFGNTLIEALSFKKKVVLVNPTTYHQKLSLNLPIHLPSFSKKNINKQSFLRALSSPTPIFSLPKSKTASIVSQYLKLKPKFQSPSICPICGSSKSKIILNEIERTIYKCSHCSTIRLFRKKRKIENTYKNQYFIQDYKKQYGKTYLEDKKNIEILGEKRIKIINNLRGNSKGLLLDIGAAYGFFLNVARKYHWKTEGIEIIDKAVQYARKKLKLQVQKQTIEKMKLKKYDVITLWYVFEHLENPLKEFSKIAKALNNGGILALGIPNGGGLTARFNLKEWLKIRPDDHFFDFTVKAFKILAKKNSLKLLMVKNRGIYFERLKKIIPLPDWKITRTLLHFFSSVFNLGDTIEVYFKKVSK